MDPYRQQYPPYPGQPPQQPHLRGPPPGSPYGPPPPHVQGRPPHMQPPMYQGAPPPHLQQPYPPPHMPGPPPFQGRGPMPPQRPPLGAGVPPPGQQYPPPHQLQAPPPGAPYGAVPPYAAPGVAPPHTAPHSHRAPRPTYGSGSLPPTAGAPPGFANPPPPSASALKGGPPSAAGPAGSIPASAFVVGGALPDKMNTLFIGSIAPGINNVAMEKLLKTTGTLVKWKRVQDPTTHIWKAFGFAEYADADSMLRTLRVLGQDGQQPKGEKPVGLELAAMDGSGVVKALLVKADERTRQFLDQYEEMRPRTIHDTEKDKVALAQAMKIIQHMKDGTLDTSEPEQGHDEKEEKGKEDPTASKQSTEAEEAEISEEQKEHIARELNFFRERAALKEKEKREQEEKAERQRASQQQREKDTESHQGHRSGRDRAWGGSSTRHMDFVPAGGSSHAEGGSSSNIASSNGAGTTDHDAGADSDAEEKARQERRERELEQSYRERERRWEQREAERMRLYEKDKARDEDYAAEQKAAKDAMAYRYAMWDDAEEREKRHEDYYRDRSRWWQRRQAFLQKEERYDSLDREEEKEEQEQEAKRAQAEAAAAAAAAAVETDGTPEVDHDGDSEMKDTSGTPTTIESSVSTPTRVDPSALPSTILPNQPTKLKLNLSTASGILKRGSETNSGSGTPTSGTGGASGFVAANEFGQDDEDEKMVKKRRVLVPLKYSDDEGDSQGQTNPHVNGGESQQSEKEKREQEVKALIQSIPADAQGLWSWPIQWQYVEEDNEQILKDKIQPFASKKVFELLGEEDEELTGFVMDYVRKRKPPQELVENLRRALDEDADVLVMKIWRMLIFETESKARKLSSR